MSRSRNYCFTINNYAESDIEKLKTTGARYIIFGREVGEQGTPHLQGYIEFDSGKTIKTVSKLLGGKAHIEPRLGSAEQAATYCKKEGQYTEFGEPSRQGHRTDLDEVATLVKSGASLSKIMEECPIQYIKYSKGIDKLWSARQEHRKGPPNVVWLWGQAGTGKSKMSCDCQSFYIKDGTQWWDGYNYETRIVIEDFDGKWPFRDFLRLLDRYPYQGQIKGGYVKINSPEIYINCEFPPEKFWHGNDLAQVTRRIDKILELNCTKVAGNSSPPLEGSKYVMEYEEDVNGSSSSG